ncbi:MAG: DUF6206 family protein [Thermodesulfobacteriota bacterium]
MDLDARLIARFEEGLDPRNLSASAVPAKLLGYGEISAIFEIEGLEGIAVKRMPLFRDRAEAAAYEKNYHAYCGMLSEAGLSLPESRTVVAAAAGRPVSLYIGQKKIPAGAFGNKMVAGMGRDDALCLARQVAAEIAKVWEFNRSNHPERELAIDAQVSNWAREEGGRWLFLDTSTPLFRTSGRETLDPELLLAAVPSLMKPLVRAVFLSDVMNRYYDPRQVALDLAANLYKEQRPDLVPVFLQAGNEIFAGLFSPITEKEAASYYRFDKLIWQTFLALRKMDRLLMEKVFRKRYEFLLPGKIKR